MSFCDAKKTYEILALSGLLNLEENTLSITLSR
jgi:hypothetical protein